MDITPYLNKMVETNASDMFFSVGAPVNIKINGKTQPINETVLRPGEVRRIAYTLMNDKQMSSFEQEMELNMAISMCGVGRFRVNIYRQRGEEAMVIRYIKGQIPTLEELNLPHLLQDLIMDMRGLILVVGSTGSGKSTTLASMINHRNTTSTGHILTIEDPIEYLHVHQQSIVDQREVGIDTLCYKTALKNALREAPDVILIGEIRDRETMQHAISFAETGHLCLSTLHANNANQALDRIVNFFPDNAKDQLLLDLSLNLRGIVSQRLIPTTDGARVPAVEVLLNSPYISDLIEKGDVDTIKEAMERSSDSGMKTFDQALFELYQSGRITKENALRHADSKNNLGLKIKLSEEGQLSESSNLSYNKDDFDDYFRGSSD